MKAEGLATRATIHLGPAATLSAGAPESRGASAVYALTDLLGQGSAPDSTARLTLVSPLELVRQVEHVQRTQSARPQLSSPRAASIALELSRALELLVREVTERGAADAVTVVMRRTRSGG